MAQAERWRVGGAGAVLATPSVRLSRSTSVRPAPCQETSQETCQEIRGPVTSPSPLVPLLSAIAKGDLEALEKLYRLSNPKLYGLALRILRRPELASDAVKAAFVRIWREAKTAPAGMDPVCWIAAITRDCALDIARTSEDTGEAWEPFEVEEPAVDPLAREDRSPELRSFLACLGKLSEERRRMILLAYYDGWSREALSVYFDAPMHTVNTWLKRSVVEIDEHLAQ